MAQEPSAPGASEEEDYQPDLITLEDENGKEHTFEVLDATEEDGARYFAMVPYSENASERLAADAEMIIMRAGEDGDGEEVLDIVEDEEELFAIGEVFLKRLREVYDIDLDELKREMDTEKG